MAVLHPKVRITLRGACGDLTIAQVIKAVNRHSATLFIALVHVYSQKRHEFILNLHFFPIRALHVAGVTLGMVHNYDLAIL